MNDQPERIKTKDLLKGLQFHLRPDTSDRQVIKEVIQQNAYQKPYFKIEPGERWLDLGANIGAFTCMAAKMGAIVDSYEPEPDNCRLLAENIALNGSNAQIHQKAVVADKEQATHLKLFISTEYGKWGHSLYKPKRKQSILVETVKMNTILDGIDGIKMDIEGAEIPILSTIETFQQVKKLVFEWHFDMMDSIPFFLETIDHLRTFFPNIKHRPFKKGDVVFHYFPTGAIVFCWK